MVYEPGEPKPMLLSGRDFPDRDMWNCGPEWNELCQYPEAPKGLLKINLSEPKNLTAVYVEFSGMPRNSGWLASLTEQSSHKHGTSQELLTRRMRFWNR